MACLPDRWNVSFVSAALAAVGLPVPSLMCVRPRGHAHWAFFLRLESGTDIGQGHRRDFAK